MGINFIKFYIFKNIINMLNLTIFKKDKYNFIKYIYISIIKIKYYRIYGYNYLNNKEFLNVNYINYTIN